MTDKTSLDDLLIQLRRKLEEHNEQAASLRKRATEQQELAHRVFARIQGIEEARELLASAVIEPKPKPRERRDIRALVHQRVEYMRRNLEKPGGDGTPAVPDHDVLVPMLANEIGCRPSQIKAALRAMEDEESRP